MAERRMLSKKILQGRQFLTMSIEAQALYPHLMLSSDDDGVVDAFPVTRMTGISEIVLDELTNKKFILPLNDDMVYFIVDFEEQNKIRADRVQPSLYRDLLLEKTGMVIDGKRVTKPKKTDVSQVSDKCLTSDGQMTAYMPADVSQVSAQYSIGKDRIGEDSIDEDRSDKVIYLNNDDNQKSFSQIIKSSNIKINERHSQMLLDYIGLDNMTVDMIQHAIEKTEDAGSTSFNYLKAILENWKKEGFTSLEEVEKHERKRQESQSYQGKKKDFKSGRYALLGTDISVHEIDPELGF